MHRTFETTTERRQRTLDGQWEFLTDPGNEGYEADYGESFPTEEADRLSVPSSWNAHREYADYVGPAWYRRTFETRAEGSQLFTFHGVARDATVYLDGEEIASHEGSYTPFTGLARNLDAGEHELVVRADNTRREATLPHDDADWFPHGGIHREVVVERVPDVYVRNLAVDYDLYGDEATVAAEVTLHNVGPRPAEPDLTVSVGDASVTDSVEVDGMDAATATLALDVEDVDRWTPDDPMLYDVEARLHGERAEREGGAFVDDLRDRIGFRTVSTGGREILVNGEPVDIAGVNRHEDHPEWGSAQPLRVQERDLDLIRRAGCNAVRCSHYPNHPRFLDLCDEAGVLVVEEIPLWQVDESTMVSTQERAQRTLLEAIERDRHHPSIFAWSLSNECANDEATVVEGTRKLKWTADGVDGSRLITVASNSDWEGETDGVFEFCDFLSVNAYWGWYRDGDWGEFLDGIEADYGEKPIVVTEFGAGAVPGDRTHEGRKWSESYQADLLADCVDLFRERESVAGFTVWQFCDTLTDPDRAMTRPRTRNNKGVLDEYRRPKEAYRVLRDRLTDE
ncbi:beta-galactosidase [Halosimplex carlsbadense 2-9-1]|uniref:Beta-galactosidase n=1 Tax=Halosimplex carlsbadense 2-9-1 TaxID=797114 RepID=M0CP38_9EURY|nr:glycoside hydrolase family 2 TIM barrel-domain containing protein [Halosimplex carlsbadense]ELZ24167.1 beta-galactosidase [Halosimplex carlsbadense 2-9-1]